MNGSSPFELLRGPSIISATGKYHGLGNRLRSVLGAYSLAKFEDRSFGYVWPIGKSFGANLNDLWQFSMPTLPASISKLISYRHPYRNHTLDWYSAAVRTERIWQIRTPHALHLPPGCPPWESELRDLTPTRPVIEYVKNTARGDTSTPFPYVGVMIRTNPVSHELTLKHSPLDWYLTRMRQIRAAWPDTRFYVAADTSEAFHTVSTAIGGCFGQAEKGQYNSREAIIASVGDLYMLAGSVHILGPHYSSFPELAQLMAGPELRLETSMTSPKVKLENNQTLSIPLNPLRPFDRSPLT